MGDQIKQAAVIGAGFSGLLTAIQLLRRSRRLRVVLIERRAAFGRGVAYDTGNPRHLLNVRLDNMSAFPDAPDHLAQWLARQPSLAPQDGFISRGVYGDYLKHLLDEAGDGAEGRLTCLHGEATTLDRQDGRWRLGLDDGASVEADAVILALGNLEPANPPGVGEDLRASGRYVENPWAMPPVDAAARKVLLIGTGLTMVDTVLSLRQPGRTFIALSRRGLLPQRHGDAPPKPYHGSFAGSPLAVMRQVRAAASEHDWRAVFDRLRAFARPLWRDWSAGERRRFLRHLRPLWDVRRHRLSPGAAREIAAMMENGEVTLTAARLADLSLRDGTVEAAWRPRGRRQIVRDRFDLVVNCTGPLGAAAQSREPLIRDVLEKGWARPDPLGLGLEVAEDGRLKAAIDNAGLYAIGPLTRGAFWEMTAVPDLRIQATTLAARIAG